MSATQVGSVQRAAPRMAPGLDVDRLAQELGEAIEGEVRFDQGARGLYSRDAGNYRQVPIGVVVPRSIKDISVALSVIRRHGAPVVPRGGGTSLAGQAVNRGVVIDSSKYLREVLEIDADRRVARVQPGVPLDSLRTSAEQYGLTFGPDPATHAWCTLGGMIGNNSCGIHSVMSGRTVDNVDHLDVLTYDGLRLQVGRTRDDELALNVSDPGPRGEIYRRLRDLRDRYAEQIRRRMPDISRRVSGYGLDQLLPENGFNVARALVGTEGTCVMVLGATVRLIESPSKRELLVLGYDDVFAAADDVPNVLDQGPIGLEGMDDRLTGYMERKGLHSESLGLLPEGDAWLLVEFGGESEAEVDERVRAAMAELDSRPGRRRSKQTYRDPAEAARVWAVRESGLGGTAFVPGMDDTWPGWEDSAVPPDRLGDYLRELRALYDRHGYHGSFYGHFGQGCVHTRTNFDLATEQGVGKFRTFVEEAADLVVSYGGSLSGEHGDGQARGELLERMYGPELVRAFGEFKGIWDPGNRMNPGKVVDSYPLDQDLTLQARRTLPEADLNFKYPDDGGSFDRATLRCVGVGKCRQTEGGTMCPSYQVLREEKHTTRGRAHLLHEMLVGEAVKDGWRSEEVKEALDLCLGCKGCRGDCPVNVDVGTYKAEFMAHYYAGRPRPRHAYAFGLIFYWARLAALAPSLVNLAAHAPVLGTVARAVAGIDQRRDIPAFGAQRFTDWLPQHQRRTSPDGGRPVPADGDRPVPADGDRRTVVLWPDTFTNNFDPRIAQSAVAVLDAAGFDVVVPDSWVCCGRPVYDFGLLDTGKKLLRHAIEVLRPHIANGTPIVGLEPSCVAVFRDELRNLYPDDDEAMTLRGQVQTLGEFLADQEWQPPRLQGRVVMHGHCHQKAVMGTAGEEALLGAMGAEAEIPDAGCCGMAGAFGFEAGEHYDVSVAAGERVLLPKVRDQGQQTFVIADGFSCREQIAQQTERRALHLAQLLHMALDGARIGDNETPEQAYARHMARGAEFILRPPASERLITLAGAMLATGAGIAAARWWSGRHGTPAM